jgi:hypothetical protein
MYAVKERLLETPVLQLSAIQMEFCIRYNHCVLLEMLGQ